MISRREPTWRKQANLEHEAVETLPHVDARDVTPTEGWNRAVALIPDAVLSFRHAATTNLSADYAEFNDRLLRAILQIPFASLSTVPDRKLYLGKLISAARIEIQKANDARVSQEFGERTETIQSSVMQLLWLIVPIHQKEPNFIFSTSVSLDVDYGMDLIGSRGFWIPANNELRVQMFVWQAKARKAGLTDKEIRDVREEYREKQARIPEDVDPNPEWLRRRLESRLRRPFTRAEIGAASNRLDTALTMVLRLTNEINNPARSTFEKFYFQDRIHRLQTLFPGANAGAAVMPPRINILRTPVIRFLVDTEQGTRSLTDAQAESWPNPPAP